MLAALYDGPVFEPFSFATLNPAVESFGHGDANACGRMGALGDFMSRLHGPRIGFLLSAERLQTPLPGLVGIVNDPRRLFDALVFQRRLRMLAIGLYPDFRQIKNDGAVRIRHGVATAAIKRCGELTVRLPTNYQEERWPP